MDSKGWDGQAQIPFILYGLAYIRQTFPMGTMSHVMLFVESSLECIYNEATIPYLVVIGHHLQ